MIWITYFVHIPNIHKYSLGENTSKLFVEAIEMTVYAGFLSREEKLPYVKIAVRKVDTIKVFLQLIWEMNILIDKQYIAISEKLDTVGKMLGGWHNNLVKPLEQTRGKQNSPSKKQGEK
ncbi:MAG: four helix bundle protein [Candidatus Paceibacterota bacterium]